MAPDSGYCDNAGRAAIDAVQNDGMVTCSATELLQNSRERNNVGPQIPRRIGVKVVRSMGAAFDKKFAGGEANHFPKIFSEKGLKRIVRSQWWSG